MSARDYFGQLIRKAANETSRDTLLRMASHLPSSLVWSLAKANNAFGGKGPGDAPDTLFFFVTNICNQSCIHCFYAAELNVKKKSLPFEGIQKIARSVKGSTKTIFLCGGEPTTRKDLPEIVKAFLVEGEVERVFITSNGLLRDRLFETIDSTMALKKKFQLRIPISIDGSEHIHDEIRKSPGGFKKALETLKQLQARAKTEPRLIPLITTVIQKGNAASFLDFYKEMRETFDCEVQFIFLRQDHLDVGGLDKSLLLDAGGSDDILPERSECERILAGIEEFESSRSPKRAVPLLRSALGEAHLKIVEEKRSLAPCIAPNSFATIFPDGGTSLCEIVKPFGNIKDYDYDMNSCWTSEEAEGQRQELSACWCTYPCALHTSLMRDPDSIVSLLKSVKSKL